MSREDEKPKHTRFSIDDAFEEETDEAIKVYGSTTQVPDNKISSNGSSLAVNVEKENGQFKSTTDTSRDSDSLITYGENSSEENIPRCCLRHPKVKENWRMVLAACVLCVIGSGLLINGALSLRTPGSLLQSGVFLLSGFICFIPGAYHVVYITLAAKALIGDDRVEAEMSTVSSPE